MGSAEINHDVRPVEMLLYVISDEWWVFAVITYTLTLFCSAGNAWMSAKLAEASRGARSGNRLSSLTNWFRSSTDVIMDRYWSGSWKEEAVL